MIMGIRNIMINSTRSPCLSLTSMVANVDSHCTKYVGDVDITNGTSLDLLDLAMVSLFYTFTRNRYVKLLNFVVYDPSLYKI